MKKFSILISSLFVMACSESAKEPNDQDTTTNDGTTTLAVSTNDAVGEEMDLCYVVFDKSGAVVLQNNAAVTTTKGVDLKDGKVFSLKIKERPVADDFSVVVVAYSKLEQANMTINESIITIDQPLILGADGMLVGDYFVAKANIKGGASSAKLTLTRSSSKFEIELGGDAQLTASVSRVDVEFEEKALFESILCNGTIAQQSQQKAVVSLLPKQNIYLLPSVSESANGALLKVYYGTDKVKEVAIGTELGLYLKSNHSTLLTIKLLKQNKPTDPSEPTDPDQPTDPDRPTDPEEPDQPSEPTEQDADITISLSGKWITKNDVEFSNTPTQSTYYTYKAERKITTSKFIPGAMALDGDLAYVVNLQGRTADGGSPSPINPNYYPLEVFNLQNGTKTKTIDSWVTSSGGKAQRLTGTPRAITVFDNKLFVSYSEGTFTPPITVVLNATTGDFITYIGRGAPWQATKDDFDTDEVMAMYATKDYLFMSDNGHLLRVYRQSDITPENSTKIKPMMMSPVESKFGKPRIMSFYRDPAGTLFRTDYATKQLLALDESKIKEGKDIDITDQDRSIDLTQSMYDDLNIISNIQTTYPYCVAYHHGNMFLGINSPNNSDQEEGLIVEYTAQGKRYGAHRSVVGHTFRKPVQIVIRGDKMIVSDQLSKQIVIVKIESHTVNHYE